MDEHGAPYARPNGRGMDKPSTAAIDSSYAVYMYYSEGYIFVRDITEDNEDTEFVLHDLPIYPNPTILALSAVQPEKLAIPSGSRVVIFDLNTRTIICTLSGTGRTTTSLAWNPHSATHVAVGAIDGSIYTWDINVPSQPQHYLGTARRPCHGIAFSPTDEHILASLHRDTISIWNLASPSRRAIHTIHESRAHFKSVAWRPGHSGELVSVNEAGELTLYDLSSVLAATTKTKSSDSDSDDDSDSGFFGEPEGIQPRLQPASRIPLISPLKDVQWISKNVLLALTVQGHEAMMFEALADGLQINNIWSCELGGAAVTARLQELHGTATLLALREATIETHDLPVNVLNSLGSLHDIPELESVSAPVVPLAEKRGKADLHDSEPKAVSTMRPVPISHRRITASGFPKTSKQLQQKRRSSRHASPPRGATSERVASEVQDPASPDAQPPMTSSLELLKVNEEEGGVPMPFLSPTIPGRRDSQATMQALDDSILNISPLPRSSFDTSMPSTAPPVPANDSEDSDDDTFVDGLESSVSFLPGGINVPLPKACGALFAPNGQLLTFFPPKVKVLSAREVLDTDEEAPVNSEGRARKVARLFPTFGTLHRKASLSIEKSDDSDSSDLSSVDNEDFGHLPSFVFQPSSFQSQQTRISPTKAGFNDQHSQHKVIISVHELQDVPSLFPEQRNLATKYRILGEADESGASVCEHNACTAEEAGRADVAQIWRLLGMLLEDKVPLELLYDASEDEDALTVAQSAGNLARTDSGIDLARSVHYNGSYGKLRWADNPLGGAWLVRRILEWAEDQADTQLLACVSAVLSETTTHVPNRHATVEEAFLKRLPSYSLDYVTGSSPKTQPLKITSGTTPILRAKPGAHGSSMHESPPKLHRGSNTSSRNASQPATPYLGSTSTTPPFSLSTPSRPPASGAASPEYHRSSFSAAAKYYAQSITDKFASYGTSPPTKKAGTSVSPNNNELSTSLPGGSWSKSVSFATSSTAPNTTRNSLLGTSHVEHDYDDGYDSDKTIDENILPQTPKSPAGGIMVTFKNEEAFADEVSGAAKERLVPEYLAVKGRAWCQYYAEQLRTWNLLAQAAELEKAMGLSADRISARPATKVTPTPSHGHHRDNTCAICFTAVRSMEQLCPSCLHTSHLSCLEDYGAEMAADGDFTCPAGCGCACSELPFIVEEARTPSPVDRVPFRKKASFTDPRRWRARVEGDSW
ncbi:hypothetical protein LTR37_008294 [Vermiconidia calcicola]|uniref:Uncharacterized protein n=1 Tax=Vermiconidia calcicola TaxID=1690605 RepID=A0ACC3NBU5_9PEZI|nr:hypothetical protein LTR37_008294 [Vermiconidia calcicola]